MRTGGDHLSNEVAADAPLGNIDSIDDIMITLAIPSRATESPRRFESQHPRNGPSLFQSGHRRHLRQRISAWGSCQTYRQWMRTEAQRVAAYGHRRVQSFTRKASTASDHVQSTEYRTLSDCSRRRPNITDLIQS